MLLKGFKERHSTCHGPGLNRNSAAKGGRKVAVLLSPDMVDALTLLVSKRSECGVLDTNEFWFARVTTEALTLLGPMQVNVQLIIQSFLDQLFCANT